MNEYCLCNNSDVLISSNSATFFTRGEDRIGGKYWKVHYVEYADAEFTRRKNLTEVTKHLGILGTVNVGAVYSSDRIFATGYWDSCSF